MENSTQATVVKAAIYVDLKRCIGCDSCSLACKQEFNVELGDRWSEIYGAEKEDYPAVKVQVLPMRCQQCDNARCKTMCDSLGYLAIQRRPDGIVTVDPTRCVGCQKCIPVCPYKAMSFNTQKTNKLGELGVADKCNFCMHRLDQGLLPACVITCLGVTLEYGDFNALRAKYPNAKKMGGGLGPKMLYGNMGDEPEHRTAGYPDPKPCHD
jgi:tetrathionate reductase subunit B